MGGLTLYTLHNGVFAATTALSLTRVPRALQDLQGNRQTEPMLLSLKPPAPSSGLSGWLLTMPHGWVAGFRTDLRGFW